MKRILMIMLSLIMLTTCGCNSKKATSITKKNKNSVTKSVDKKNVKDKSSSTDESDADESSKKEKKSINNSKTESKKKKDDKKKEKKNKDVPEDAEEMKMYDIDGNNENFAFTYNDEVFYAYYKPENWQIVDSYKIIVKDDMITICQALIDIHPLHGSDGESWREPEDMAKEWLQHNIAYNILPDGDIHKENAKDVDFNPEDQGKSMVDMYNTKMY